MSNDTRLAYLSDIVSAIGLIEDFCSDSGLLFLCLINS
jgi:hypothetical protein